MLGFGFSGKELLEAGFTSPLDMQNLKSELDGYFREKDLNDAAPVIHMMESK